MSFSSDGLSRNTIQAIQFELWPDCYTGCEYCYLKGTPRITTIKDKSKNIYQTVMDIINPELMKDYNAVGLIGGEFFQGQLAGVKTEWQDLIVTLSKLLDEEEIKEVWLATSLIFDDLADFKQTLDILTKYELKENQRITICTSYDTIGRFRNENCLDIWKRNMQWIKENYPQVSIHIQTILTQDTIEKLIDNINYFDNIATYDSIDFRYPSISRADCPTVTGIKDYRAKMLEKLHEFPKHFFIEDRNLFLRFLKVFYNKYGRLKVLNLIHQPEMRSRRLKIYIEGTEIEDRWNDTRDIYLPCGHLVDGLCYVNDSTHCIYCDIEKFIKRMEINYIG